MHLSYGYCYLAGHWAEISRAKAGQSLLSRGRGDAAVGGEAALPGDQGLSLTCSATSGKLFSVLSWPEIYLCLGVGGGGRVSVHSLENQG